MNRGAGAGSVDATRSSDDPDRWASGLDIEALLDDRDRLLTLRTVLPAHALLPEHLTMREALSEPFELVLDCVSTSAHLELKRFIGEQMTVRLKQADGGYAPWHGYVTQAAQLGSDGGLARYRLTLGPWLAWLSLRLDCFVFQDQTAIEIIEEVFADYPPAQWRLALSEATLAGMRKRSVCTQYRETDLSFVSRLLAQEGLHYWFEHLADTDLDADLDAEAPDADPPRARHVLVIADAHVERPDLGLVRFTAQVPTASGHGPSDTVTSFATRRRLTSNAVTLGSWDASRVAGTSAGAASSLALGEVPPLEVYDGSGARRFEDGADAQRAASLSLAALELQAKRFDGAGGARRLRPGARFALIDHPSYGADATALDGAGALGASRARADNAFAVLAVEHEASNNLGSQAARLLGRGALARGTYRNRFACVLAVVPVVPPHRPAILAPSALTARVVGIDGSVVHAERGHRVKVQMHFQRGLQPNPGGRAPGFGADARGNAPGDERSGAWVPVAGPAAGANWGAVYTPRIGSEVVVQFIEGDIDRPVIVGGVYGGADRVPFAAGTDSGVNHPGVIAGLHSERLDGAGFNQLALDDAPGQLRARLHSSHAGSELGLGHLIEHSADSAERGSWRGSGFEAHTAAWASARAGRGLFVSTTARPGSGGHAPSTQMDASEAVAQLRAARDLGQRLGHAAMQAGASPQPAHDAGQALEKMLAALDPEAAGRHPPQVNGQAAVQSGRDGRHPGVRPVHAFADPLTVFDTPCALLAASQASVTAFAGQALNVTAQGDMQQTAAHTLTQASGGTASLCAIEGGIQVVAANGPVSVCAHTDALSILADASMTVVSVNDAIRIGAKDEIRIVAGQSSITLKGGDVEFATPGAFTVKGATHAFEGGGSTPAVLPTLPSATFAETVTSRRSDH